MPNFLVTVSFHDADANDVTVLVEAVGATEAENRGWDYFAEDGVAELASRPATPGDEERYAGVAI